MKPLIYKIIFSILLLLSGITGSVAQTLKVAILDFENISGIPKYDGLGKAMSSMLITDIEANVSPKRLQLVERSQILKIMKEQNFQASTAVDKNSTVKAGKILGVKYLLLGDIYVLNDALIINARFIDAETGDIKFSKKQEGKLPAWLSLKTNIAKELATSISMPFTEPTIQDKETPLASITTFGNAISAKDTGNIKMAEMLVETVQEFNPDFKYVEGLKKEIEDIKKRLDQVEEDIEITTTDPASAARNYADLGNFNAAEKYYLIALKRLNKRELGKYILYNHMLAEMFFLKLKDYNKTITYCNDILEVYPYYDQAIVLKAQSQLGQNKKIPFLEFTHIYLINVKEVGKSSVFHQYLRKYVNINNIEEQLYDISTNGSGDKGFRLTIGDITVYQGTPTIFEALLNEYCEANTSIFGLDSTIRFLKKLNSINPYSTEKSDMTITEPYYLPKHQYTFGVSTIADKLIILETGNKYIGSYFKKSDGTKWTMAGPPECPCKRLVSSDEFEQLKKITLEEQWQRSSFRAEGWYLLYKGDTKNARNMFLDCIYYDTKNAMRYEGYRPVKEKMDSLFKDYKHQEINNYFSNIIQSGMYEKSDDLVNNMLNFAHTYALEDSLNAAILIYKKFDMNYLLEKFDVRIKESIETDLKDFLSRKLISQTSYNRIISSLN